MSEFGTYGLGNLVLPLTSSTSNSLLKDADPVMYYLLDYFEAMLIQHVGARFTAAVTAAGSPISTSVVAMKVPYNPARHMQDPSFKLPLFSIYRTKGTMYEKSRSFAGKKTQIEMLWMLPPLDASQMELLGPIQNAVVSAIHLTGEQGFDPSYLSGASVGQLAGFEAFRFTDYEYALAQGTNMLFETVIIRAELTERETVPAGEFKAYTGTDVEQDLIANVNDTPAGNLNNLVNTSD
jgi:hypothetical protein